MTSDTSSSSSSSDDYKKRKSHKKHKKAEKKHKKQKKQKKQHTERKRTKISAPEILPKVAIALVNDDDGDVPAFGPALPPSLTQHLAHKSIGSAMIGPALPGEFTNNKNNEQTETVDFEDEDDGFGFGPMPEDNRQLSANQIEREQRALELKIAAIEGRGIGQDSAAQKSREEWMLELPDVGLRSGLASLSNMKRTFYAGKEKPDFSDRSAWTKTPQSENAEQQPSTSKTTVETLRSKAEAKYERERDDEQERLAKKHKKKHKREESLVELHQKKLRKEQKQKEKELAASGAKPERRPFSRDVDLKLNKIDKNQTKQIVDKAKILDSKFSSGKAKYL